MVFFTIGDDELVFEQCLLRAILHLDEFSFFLFLSTEFGTPINTKEQDCTSRRINDQEDEDC